MRLTFWGTRGSIPVPGPGTLRYGGNTTCAEVDYGQGSVIIDAGTGIRRLGSRLLDEPSGNTVDLLVTHLHWDHIMGFPFFGPAYRKDTQIRVGGWPRALQGLSGLFDSRHCDGCFPVRFHDLAANVEQSPELAPPRFAIGELSVTTLGLHHPQGSLGFKFEVGGRTLVFITDHELRDDGEPGPEATARFCQGADLLVHDSQYMPEEMGRRQGFGHSDWLSVVGMARQAGVGRLVLTHHDPERDDDQVDKMVEMARQEAGAGLAVTAAAEGVTLEV